MPNPQALYDILKEAFEGGRRHAVDMNVMSSHILFPLAARMEEEVKRQTKAMQEECATLAESYQDQCCADAIRALRSSPERET